MKVILLQNTIYKAERKLAGATVEMDNKTAKNFISANLAYAVKSIAENPVNVSPKKTTKKKVSK